MSTSPPHGGTVAYGWLPEFDQRVRKAWADFQETHDIPLTKEMVAQGYHDEAPPAFYRNQWTPPGSNNGSTSGVIDPGHSTGIV
jgi:hypothetical protein